MGVWSLQAVYDSKAPAPPSLVKTGLVMRLDAADPASYPGTGTTWTDLSGSGNNFTLNNASAYTSGSIPHMNFEGSYGWAYKSTGTDVTATTNATMMVFSTIKNSTGDWRTLLRGTSNGNHQVIIESGSNRLGMYDPSYGFRPSGFDITTLPNPYTQFNCLTWRMSQSSPYYRFSYNANPITYDITGGGPWSGFYALGAWQGGSQFWGKIALVLLYDRTLTNAEITQNYSFFKTRFSLPEPLTQYTGITYSQSSVYPSNGAATYAGMNDNSAVGSSSTYGYQTGTYSETNAYVKADLGSSKYVDQIIIGYDYQSNLPGGWGVTYTQGLNVQGSNDNSNWTTITTTPTYSATGSSNGLVSISIKNTWRYLRIHNPSGYVCLLEFQVWG